MVDPVEEQAFKRKTRKCLMILIVSSVVLVAVIIGAVAGTLIHKSKSDSSSDFDSVPASFVTPATSIKAVCSVTLYPDSCISSISSLDTSNTTDPEELLRLSLQAAIAELSKLSSLTNQFIAKAKDANLKKTLGVCDTVFQDAIDHRNDSISSMEVAEGGGGGGGGGGGREGVDSLQDRRHQDLAQRRPH